MPNIKSPNYAQLQQQFFNTGTTADIAIKKLAADIRRQDSMFHFLPAFVRKNGIPRWDKVIYSSNHSNSGNQLSTYGVNATGNTVKYTQSNKTEGSQGIFFIPLQAQNTNTIQSYIVAYKHNDSLYTYRLYNRDSLNAIRPKTSIAKNNLLNTQAVFGYFEQTVNNRDGITIESPVSGKIKNVEIAFHATRNNSANSTQSLNGTMVGGGCEMSIEVTISYSLEVTLDGNTIYITESYSVTLTIIIDCTGGGSCNCTTPKDNIIDGVGGTGNTNGNWWDYGTGYPYFPWNPGGGIIGGGPTEPDWSWWWTGGGGGSYIPSYNDYAVPPFTWTFIGDDGTSFNDPDPLNEPDFQFDPADNYETNYPRFTDMVKNLKTFVKNNPKVLNALQTYSGFSKQKILNHLTIGQGPTIKVEEMTGRFGFYNKNNGNKTLHIRASYVRGLEQAYLQSTQEATAFLLAVTILHEYIHLGTTQNNISEGVYDFGYGFERDAFNVIVDDDNAGTVVLKFSQYF
ncbi:MAG: hypothetical protein GTN67_06570 [Hydrotalea flava]|nr:hypothetical protein [Hydrotalea flava]NIM37917.1 hypothetical protein [Hydrotalea flava]NIN03086.1 hypothetical protein [Hydrotalea flava]NIN14771.1 hypothetical protein [Hydrotalea flava]NIO93843.1 hypothetical protein [Hydrotalea flava]